MKTIFYDWMQTSASDVLRYEYNITTDKSGVDSFKKTIMITPDDFVLDYPRPLMPHVIPIPGLFVMEPRTLDKTWLIILDSYPEVGVIILSFGSVISPLDAPEALEMVALVFSRLPQQIIWKYDGPTPKILGANIHLL